MSRARSKFYKILLLMLMIGLLVGVSFSQRNLNRQRTEMGLTRIDPLENAPPILAFTTVALGGFRGLIANALWIRANDLQEEGKYFEMVQLADWITKLQPHFVTVWVHQAWNMAYNISIKFTEPQDRWQWVSRGIELLRDDGLRFNPKEPLIYRELGWIFQHKMGHYMDDAHEYYKQYWASEMSRVLASGRPNWEELINPQTPETKERVRLLKERFKMDPTFMKLVDEKYGPLEWRLPETSAIYWATLGLEKTKDQKLKKEDFITLRRVVFQSLQLAFHRGKMIYPRKNSLEFIYGPNLEIIRQASESYEEMMSLEPEKEYNVKNAHKNFLGTSVYFLYVHGRTQAAEQWFAYLKKLYPQAVDTGLSMEDYAISRVSEEVGDTDPNRMRSVLEGLLEQSFMNAAFGEDELAQGYQRLAAKIRERYMVTIGKISEKRVGLPPLSETREVVLKRLLAPDSGLDPVIAAQLRTALNLPANYGLPATPVEGGAISTNAPPPRAASLNQ
ncbi:MAG: hypothetical protein SFY81_16940 [Verrucomicrobiota bacterium]|nr:hypothetical protein [Verrucomicrobiota bacterium]